MARLSDSITYGNHAVTGDVTVGGSLTVNGVAVVLSDEIVDADLLQGEDSAFYRDASNLNAGTLPAARFDDAAHGDRSGGSSHDAVTTSVNGFMIAADKVKLNGVEAGAEVNDPTNLGHSRNGTTVTVTSSTGTNTVIQSANTTEAGFLSASDKLKLDGLENVNLTGGTNVTVSGTYPNLTLSSTDTNTTYSAGDGLNLSGTSFSADSTLLRTNGDGSNLSNVDAVTLEGQSRQSIVDEATALVIALG